MKKIKQYMENLNLHEKRKSTDTSTDITKISQLSINDFTADISKMIQ